MPSIPIIFNLAHVPKMSSQEASLYEQKAGWIRSCLLFCIVFTIVATPAFFRQYNINAEEHVSFFSTAYGLRLFYPGQNRILSVLPILTSWLGTPRSIAVGHLFIAVCMPSAAVAFFAKFLPRSIFYPFSLFLIVAIITVFGGDRYAFHLSSASPYLVPFSLSLISCTVLLYVAPSKRRSRIVFWVVVLVVVLAGAGINPSSSLLSAIVLSLYMTTTVIGSLTDRKFAARAVVANTVGAVRENGRLSLGILLNCFATFLIFWLSWRYQLDFPQYVMSNYSVASYTNSGLSWAGLADSFIYLIEFHAPGGLFGVRFTGFLIVLACVSGLASGGLYLRGRRKSPAISRYYLAAFLIWVSAILIVSILSQNSHVQLVQNLIQGRYYTIPLYVVLLSSCLTGAVALVAFAPGLSRVAPKHADIAWLSACCALALAVFCAQSLRNEFPTPELAASNPLNIGLPEKIKAMDAQAIVGNYWWIWEIQYELNRGVAGAPIATPVTIRTEAFGLRIFNPIVLALSRSKSFRFVCIELKDPSPGLDEACLPQLESYRAKGGFPLGNIRELSRSEVNRYKLTLYELGLANASDRADCTASQILLRAKPVASTVPSQDSYNLDEDSFVYLQRPEARADWVLRFTADGVEEVVIVPREGQSYFHLLKHRIAVTGGGCRLLVTVSRRDRLYPHTMKLDVR